MVYTRVCIPGTTMVGIYQGVHLSYLPGTIGCTPLLPAGYHRVYYLPVYHRVYYLPMYHRVYLSRTMVGIPLPHHGGYPISRYILRFMSGMCLSVPGLRRVLGQDYSLGCLTLLIRFKRVLPLLTRMCRTIGDYRHIETLISPCATYPNLRGL